MYFKTKPVLLMVIFLCSFTLLSCSRQLKRADFGNLPDKNFHLKKVYVELGDDLEFGLDNPKVYESIYKSIPYEKIAVMMEKRYGIKVDLSSYKAMLSRNTKWDTDVLSDPDTDNTMGILIIVIPETLKWEKEGEKKLRYSISTKVRMMIWVNMAHYAEINYIGDISDFDRYKDREYYNVINDAVLTKKDKKRFVDIQEKFTKMFESDMKTKFSRWLEIAPEISD